MKCMRDRWRHNCKTPLFRERKQRRERPREKVRLIWTLTWTNFRHASRALAIASAFTSSCSHNVFIKCEGNHRETHLVPWTSSHTSASHFHFCSTRSARKPYWYNLRLQVFLENTELTRINRCKPDGFYARVPEYYLGIEIANVTRIFKIITGVLCYSEPKIAGDALWYWFLQTISHRLILSFVCFWSTICTNYDIQITEMLYGRYWKARITR